jgi:hypothetical protein
MLATLGEPEQGREWLAQALTIEPEDFITLYDVASGFAALGEHEQAIALL